MTCGALIKKIICLQILYVVITKIKNLWSN